MQGWTTVVTNNAFLDKAGLVGVTLIVMLIIVWLLLRYAGNLVKVVTKMQVDAMDRQATLHAEAQARQAQAHVDALQTVRQSIDNNTATVQSLENRMSDFQGTLHELYGFLKHLVSDRER